MVGGLGYFGDVVVVFGVMFVVVVVVGGLFEGVGYVVR